jgi:PKHD-type hydroxylase
MLLHLPDLLDAADLAEIRQLLAHAPWADGQKSAGRQARQVKNNQQLPRDCEAALKIQSKVLGALDKSALFFSAALPGKIYTPHVNRYGGDSNFYGEHVDGAVRFAPHTGLKVRTDLSATVFLSDPGEYEGGELVIGSGLSAQRVKLPAGHMALYPGTSVHQVLPVTKGARCASFFWVESMVRSNEQRQILFDMDMHLMRLRSTVGETDPAIIGLTGTYHNLLRQWADT